MNRAYYSSMRTTTTTQTTTDENDDKCFYFSVPLLANIQMILVASFHFTHEKCPGSRRDWADTGSHDHDVKQRSQNEKTIFSEKYRIIYTIYEWSCFSQKIQAERKRKKSIGAMASFKQSTIEERLALFLSSLKMLCHPPTQAHWHAYIQWFLLICYYHYSYYDSHYGLLLLFIIMRNIYI